MASFTCLQSLELEGCRFLPGKGLLKIAQNNPQLHSINLLNTLCGRDQSAILEILEKDLIRLTDLKLDICDIEDEKMAVLDRVASFLQYNTSPYDEREIYSRGWAHRPWVPSVGCLASGAW